MDALVNQMYVIPYNLRYYLHRLADDAQPSTNILKVNAMNSTTASSGSLITVRLPMALCDLNSFAMHFATNVTDGVAGTDGTTTGVRGILPKGIEGLISRLEVSVNGLGLLNLQQYNLLYSLLKETHQSLDKSLTRRVLQNEVDVTPMFNSVGGTYPDSAPMTIFNWTATTSTTTATVTGYTSCVSPVPFVDSTVFGVPSLGALGLATGGTVTAGTVSVTAVAVTPCYTQTFNSQAINGPLIYKVTFTLTTSTTWTYTAPSAYTPFTLYVGSDSLTNAGMLINQNNFHSITDWLSFFKAQPNWIQTQMLGEVEIRITLNDNSVLGIAPSVLTAAALSTSNPTTVTQRPDYSLYNIYFTLRTCSFSDNFADDLLHAKLSEGGELEIPFDNYFNVNQVQSAGSSSTRFSVNTQSLNKVIGINRPFYYNTIAGAQAVIPTGMGCTNTNNLGLVHKTPFFQTYAANPSASTWNGGNVVPNSWQYQINSQFIPNLKVDPSTTYFYNLEAYNAHNDWCSSTTAANPSLYLNSQYQMIIALDFMDSIPRLLSGVDSRGAVSVNYLLQDNNNNADRTDIFTCFTSVLRVAANQQLQVVY